jgi:hypothetical protein
VRRTYSGSAGAVALALAAGAASAQVFHESFDDIATLPGSGWFSQNNSNPIGTTGWNQGVTDTFPPQSTAGYLSANYNNASDVGTISNWMLTPTRTLHNGDVFRFYTRTVDAPSYPDRMQVRLSTNGSSTNVGFGETEVGDFTTLLLDINPNYTLSDYPTAWTEYTLTLSGLPAAGAPGRLAFRYFVENAGPLGDRSDYIGIDEADYIPAGTPTGACCMPNGTCSIRAQATCGALGGVYAGDGTACSASTCPSGGCCLPEGDCTIMSPGGCTAAGGVFRGNGTSCASPCPLPAGQYNYAGPVVDIPDGAGSGGCGTTVFAEIVVPDSFTVTSATTRVYIPIEWQGDIQFRLVHGAVSVPLATRPGTIDDPPYGFSAVNYGTPTSLMRFTDAGATRYNSPEVAPPGVNDVSGDWRPDSGTMSQFAGTNAQGVWRLEAEDCAEGITGVIQAFRINLGGAPSGSTCYPNCDQSTNVPFLNVLDFNCFLNRYTAGDSYANCDSSTNPPVLNILDFNCFLNRYTAGCSAP